MTPLSRVLEDDLGRLAGLLLRDAPRALDARRLVAAMRRAIRDRRAEPPPGPLQLRLMPDATVENCPLGCPVKAVVCVARQIQSQMEQDGFRAGVRTGRRCRGRADPDRDPELARHDGKRGTLASRPTCVTAHCDVGAAVRHLLGDTDEAVEMARRAPRATDASEGGR